MVVVFHALQISDLDGIAKRPINIFDKKNCVVVLHVAQSLAVVFICHDVTWWNKLSKNFLSVTWFVWDGFQIKKNIKKKK